MAAPGGYFFLEMNPALSYSASRFDAIRSSGRTDKELSRGYNVARTEQTRIPPD
jgi:hypothetical protein